MMIHPPLKIDFNEFLDLVKVIKMLYGRDIATRFFENYIKKWYNVNSESMLNPKDNGEWTQ